MNWFTPINPWHSYCMWSLLQSWKYLCVCCSVDGLEGLFGPLMPVDKTVFSSVAFAWYSWWSNLPSYPLISAPKLSCNFPLEVVFSACSQTRLHVSTDSTWTLFWRHHIYRNKTRWTYAEPACLRVIHNLNWPNPNSCDEEEDSLSTSDSDHLICGWAQKRRRHIHLKHSDSKHKRFPLLTSLISSERHTAQSSFCWEDSSIHSSNTVYIRLSSDIAFS